LWLYFDAGEQCIDYIKTNPTKKVFLIITGRLGQQIIPELHNLIQLHSIYIYCGDITVHKQWSYNFDKITDVYNDPVKLLVQFQKDLVEYGLQLQSIPKIINENNSKVNIFSQPDQNWCPWETNSCTKKLTLKGQCTIEIIQFELIPFELSLTNIENLNEKNIFGILLNVTSENVTISKIVDHDIILLQESSDDESILQNDCFELPNNIYWFSLDSDNLLVKYGTGEIRDYCKIIECYLTEQDRQQLKEIKFMHIKLNNNVNINELEYLKNKIQINIGVKPVLSDPPLLILTDTHFTNVDDLINLTGVSVSALEEPCRKLYSNISNFNLNTDDFPHFTKTIEESIRNPNGWCYKKLREKVNHFGKRNLRTTYLRITLDRNIHIVSGIPYVLEIWPSGHNSPIHNHGNSYGIIRVLYNEILISLYRSLNENNQKSIITRLLHENDCTWILPKLNQTHQISNVSRQCCIMLQCYQYDKEDTKHYEYFNYINNTDKTLNHFNLESDMDYIEFKNMMRRELIEK
ncbi:unnamed protein product, partial [Didymodactylos carnosus]